MITQNLENIDTKCYQGTRKYRSEKGISTFVYDILPDKLTLYPRLNPVLWRETKNSELKTIFREVEIMPFDEANPHAAEQLKPFDNIKRVSVAENEYAEIVWKALRFAIEDLWDPECQHYAFSSSGYDSRLIAMLIYDLWQELGDEWLGDMYFIEADGESIQFMKNMAMIGWGQRYCLVYNEGASVHEHHKRSFDFETAWRKLGGMCGFPVNFNWEGQNWMQEHGDMPEDGQNCQIFYGYSSNEIATTMRFHKTLYQYFSEAYLQSISGPRGKVSGTTVPFHHFGVMENVLRYGAEHIKPNTGLSHTVLKHMAPAEIADVVSPIHRTKHITVRMISDSILQHAIDDYRASWFGKQFPDIEPTNIVKYDRWWACWCIASFCEQLLSEGYEIGIK